MNNQHILIRKFNAFTLFLLGTLFVFSCVWAYFSNQALAQEASIERANYIAGAISDSIVHAMEVGVPLDSMRGVNALLRTRANENENIHHLAILDLSGTVMWQAAGAVQDSTPVRVTSDINFQGHTVAYVQASVYLTELFPMMVHAIFLQIILCIMAYVTCYESMIFSLGRGVLLRRDAKVQMRQAILSGKLNTIVVGANRPTSDSVLYGMVLRLRRLNENIWRMRRLTASLRITEPDADIRSELETTLAKAEGTAVFADRKPEIIVLPSTAIDVRWLYFMSVLAVESVLQVMVPDTLEWTSPLLVLWSVAGSVLGLFFARRFALKRSAQILVTVGSLIILGGFIVVALVPLTLYSVAARFIVYFGLMTILYGCYGLVQHEKSSHQWLIATVTGGLLLGRILSLLVLEWFGGRELVGFATLMLLWMLFLANKFSWSQTNIWCRPIGKLELPAFTFKPISVCNGILSGLLFSFALATFVFNEGAGNEMIVTLLWFLLGLGAWFGYQLPNKWRWILWGLAIVSSGILIFEQMQADAINLLFCLSLSALDWHIRVHNGRDKWPFNFSDFIGIAIGASIYLVILYYFSLISMPIVFLSLLIVLGLLLFKHNYMHMIRRERS